MIGAHTGLPWPAIYHRRGGGGPPPPYAAKAVNFDTDVSISPSIDGQNIAPNSSKVLTSIWFNVPTGSIASFPALYQLRWDTNAHILTAEVGGVNDTDISSVCYNLSIPQTARIDSPDGAIAENQWYNLLFYGSLNFAAGGKTLVQYLNDIAVGAITDNLNPTTISFSNIISAIVLPASNVPLEFADLQIYPGVDLDLTVTANRRLFISDTGKPVDPAIAVAALGPPAILFSGNASTFATNQGTGGAFTTTGVITNAATSPSD